MSPTKEKPGCAFCERTGYAWPTSEGKLICFNCLRAQRNDYRDQAERLAEENAALAEYKALADRQSESEAEYEISLAHVVRECGDLKEANRALQALLNQARAQNADQREAGGAGAEQALRDCYHLLEDVRARMLGQLGGEP